MAYQSIGLGTSANDGTGDTLRTGGDKINDNFVEIYTKLGDGSTLSSDSFVTLTGTETLTNKTITGTFTGDITGDVTGNVSSTSGNIELDAATHVVEVMGGGSDSGGIKLNCEANSHGQTIVAQPHSESVTNTLTLPAGSDQELVGTTDTQTLTNKTLTAPTITGSGAIAGVFTGDLTGDVTGNVDGNISGEVTLEGTAPASASATGTAGEVRYDADYIYVCTATDTWKRVAISTWA